MPFYVMIVEALIIKTLDNPVAWKGKAKDDAATFQVKLGQIAKLGSYFYNDH